MYAGRGSTTWVYNTITAFNNASAAGGVACHHETGLPHPNDGHAELYCSDVYGNAGGDWVDCIWNQGGQNGNFSADPLFCDPDNGDFGLRSASPCAPQQNPDCGLIGAHDVGCAVSWFEDFDSYDLGSGMHGQGGWKGWDNDVAYDAFVTDAQAHSTPQSVEIAGNSDLVHLHSEYASGCWTYTAWMYVPQDFGSGGTEDRGSYFVLLNTYNDGGPYHWSVQLHADSDTNSFIRDGVSPASSPLITGRWVKLEVDIDLDNDSYRVFYDGTELGAAASWTAGVFGGGGGVPDIAAVDLFANGSTPVYWDDLSLMSCAEREACCLPDSSCVMTPLLTNECADRGGDPQGPGTDCDTANCQPLKWSQPPLYNPASPKPECLWGWDEPSIYGGGEIAADDWLCTSEQPISDIHWWGSYIGWADVEPPPGAPESFHIGIWTDVPAGVDQPFSHPDTLIHEWIVPREELNERPVACDYHPDFMSAPEACFRYDFVIPEPEWFYQEPSCNIYWISIAAMYSSPWENAWGWKTREHFFNDDGVIIWAPMEPQLGSVYQSGVPLELQGTSWDLAFALTTVCDDADDDGVCDHEDNCPSVPNLDQSDSEIGWVVKSDSFEGSTVDTDYWFVLRPEYLATTTEKAIDGDKSLRMYIDEGGYPGYVRHDFDQPETGTTKIWYWYHERNLDILSINGNFYNGVAYWSDYSTTHWVYQVHRNEPGGGVYVSSVPLPATKRWVQFMMTANGSGVEMYVDNQDGAGFQLIHQWTDEGYFTRFALGHTWGQNEYTYWDLYENDFEPVEVASPDGVGDACDNCWYVPNPDQNDSDGNCADPPYLSDPLCGDACQECLIAGLPFDDPIPVPVDIGFGTKNRYLSFMGGDPGRLQAVQVTFVNLPDFPFANGRTAWVQEPFLVTEASGDSGPMPPPTMRAAVLDCDPYYTDWSTYGTVHVYDAGIVQGSTYQLRLIDSTCDRHNAGDYGPPLMVDMSAIGDVVRDCGVTPCSAPQGAVDFVDISAVVEKFKNTPGAPRKARADIINSDIALPVPDRKVDFVDISYCVEAFRGSASAPPGPPPNDPCGPPAKISTQRSSLDVQPVPLAEPVVVTLEPSAPRIRPGARVEVDAYATNVHDLRAYQVALSTKGGDADELIVKDLRIDSGRPGYLFAPTDAITAVDPIGKRLGATSMGDGVTTTDRVYLGTFILRAAPDAKGDFSLELRLDDGSTFLRNSSLAPIPIRVEGSNSVTIEVGLSPHWQHTVGSER